LFKVYTNLQRCAQKLLSPDRDETQDPCFRDETETFKILSKMRRLKSETRRCSFRDAGRDVEALETRELQRLAKTFSLAYGETR